MLAVAVRIRPAGGLGTADAVMTPVSLELDTRFSPPDYIERHDSSLTERLAVANGHLAVAIMLRSNVCVMKVTDNLPEQAGFDGRDE